LLASCATKPPQQRTPPPVVVEPAPVRVLSPAEFVRRAASIDLFVVRASELALQRSSEPQTRALAERLLAEHRGLTGQLSMAGRRLNLLPAAAMLPEQGEWMGMLERSSPFEIGFRRRLTHAHQEAVDLHSAFARAGSSPTLRPVAANAERVERRHLAELTVRR
jgi:putative membrane protein